MISCCLHNLFKAYEILSQDQSILNQHESKFNDFCISFSNEVSLDQFIISEDTVKQAVKLAEYFTMIHLYLIGEKIEPDMFLENVLKHKIITF